jgi:hypothetical protein
MESFWTFPYASIRQARLNLRSLPSPLALLPNTRSVASLEENYLNYL